MALLLLLFKGCGLVLCLSCNFIPLSECIEFLCLFFPAVTFSPSVILNELITVLYVRKTIVMHQLLQLSLLF